MESQDLSQRGNWGSKVAFVFAASGSAIGLGNIWRFPMVVGQNGGALFVLVYILAVAFIGFSVMLAELVIGRYSQKNPVGAFESIKPGSLWKLIGYFGILTAVCIFSYYAVIAGWSVGYLIKMASGSFKADVTSELSDKIFTEFSSDPLQVILYFLLMMGITTYIVSKGIKGGIERWTKILMPILFILIVFLSGRALTLPGAEEGISFYLKPDFSQLSGKLVLYALGQAFFSLSLGMGIMVTYGSYLSKTDNLVTSAGWVCFFDSLIAFLAGIIIFPTLFAIPGIAPTAGPGLVFKVLPLIFSKIPGGYLFGILFFCLFMIAALTSTISLLEVPVAYFVDERRWSRKKAAILVGFFVFLLGIPSALSSEGMAFFTKIDFMGKMDFIFANVSLAIGALLICIILGYVWGVKNAAQEVQSGNPQFKLRFLWAFSIKFLSPVAIIVILYFIKTIAG
ncbi:MAG: sodium-dependent transporter [Candidatus Aminicenantes bacterium]|nr:sodium-dependent transporter [Candidatus Aminicenantes bacterium]MDH5386269.1 sodium-dependent transporter [Candidatus Aminicenantes bacterium]MDH5743465.1 sodium-dependent transporter [Candidatus Aminicenantes bacterium]